VGKWDDLHFLIAVSLLCFLSIYSDFGQRKGGSAIKPDKSSSLEIMYCDAKFEVLKECIHSNSSFYFAENNMSTSDIHVMVWDEDKIKFFDTLIHEDFHIIDAGASYGAFSLLAKKHPSSRWFCFEPNPNVALKLSMNLALNNCRNVEVHNWALSKKLGFQNLWIPNDHIGLSTLAKDPKRFNKQLARKLIVPVTSVNNLFSGKRIDLIKSDIEGGELNLLKGSTKILSNQRPLLFLELQDSDLRQQKSSKNRAIKLLKRYDYKITAEFGADVLAVPSEQVRRVLS
jgi:FkbM family methyltransferase